MISDTYSLTQVDRIIIKGEKTVETVTKYLFLCY